MSDSAVSSLAVFKASNGMEIYHHSPAETKYVYREIFEERVYFRHGINLKKGEIVFDIGANIGLFTIFVMEHFEEIKAFAFEPGPSLVPILKANVQKYGKAVTVYDCGVAAERGSATFTFYPGYSIMSGFKVNPHDRIALRTGIQSHLRAEGVSHVQDRFLNGMVDKALSGKQEFQCQLRSISEVMKEQELNEIGLLKIDAEGSELEVLRGIQENDWAKIRQLVIEVHDPELNVCRDVRHLLETRGFDCVLEEETRLKGSGIVNCFARRP